MVDPVVEEDIMIRPEEVVTIVLVLELVHPQYQLLYNLRGILEEIIRCMVVEVVAEQVVLDLMDLLLLVQLVEMVELENNYLLHSGILQHIHI
jgi:hypothetical protein